MSIIRYYGIAFLIMFVCSILAVKVTEKTENEYDFLTKSERDFFGAIRSDEYTVNDIKELLNYGVDINDKNKNGETALLKGVSLAYFNEHLDTIRFLIDQGIDINATDRSGDTALSKIVFRGCYDFWRSGEGCKRKPSKIQLDIIKELLINDAAIDIKNDKGETPISIAQECSEVKNLFVEIFSYKLAVVNNGKNDALVDAITHGGKNDSAFTEKQWLRLALLRGNDTQILYALDKGLISKDDILMLMASVPRIPYNFVLELIKNKKVTKEDLEKYSEIALKDNFVNKKFGIIAFFAAIRFLLRLEEKNIPDSFLFNVIKNYCTLDEEYQEDNDIKQGFIATLKNLLVSNVAYDHEFEYKGNKYTALSLVSKNKSLKTMFYEIVDYKNAVDIDKKADALADAIGKRALFNEKQWLMLALLRKDNKQIWYALDNDLINVNDILQLISSLPRIPLDFIQQLLDKKKITFEGLKSYYDSAKKANNKKFGTYYLELQSIRKHKTMPEEILLQIGSFLPTESTKENIKKSN